MTESNLVMALSILLIIMAAVLGACLGLLFHSNNELKELKEKEKTWFRG